MFLLEHDAKTLLAQHGVPVPHGVLLEHAKLDAELPPGPWMVKAQITAGGRGRAGLIRAASTHNELLSQLRDLLGTAHKNTTVRACRVETQLTGVEEAYLSLMLDPVAGGVRVIVSAHGGVDIESLATTAGAVRSATAAPRSADLAATAAELVLLEINPLFVRTDGGWTAGDAKIVTDDDALYRQPQLCALLDRRAAAYPEARRKQQHGCDYVVVDPDGEIGLLTTGAGLSMMLVDELRAAGFKPYNFLDVRASGLRGDATRLVNVLNWIAEGRRVRVLLVNIFAGITDLGEFAHLLIEAFGRVPQLNVPVVARLIGTNLDVAREFLAGHNVPVVTELSAAFDRVRRELAP